LISVLKKYTPGIAKRSARALQARARALLAKYDCPVCDARVSAFRPLPEYYSENLEKYGWPYAVTEAETCNHLGYLCPNCEASDRDRLYAIYVKAYLQRLQPGSVIRMVDFAPSPPLSHFIRKEIAHATQDIFYRTADAFAANVDDTVDISDLKPYEDDYFDFFLCSHVLEHVTDDRKALHELHRILKNGGKGILMVPIILSINEIDEDPTIVDEGERWRRFGQNDHVRLYSKYGFLERVREAGFTVYQHGKDFFGEELFSRSGISTESVLYVVEKCHG
jgi:SAM-dependent methyltransferase